MITRITRPQRETLLRKWQQSPQDLTYRAFRKGVEIVLGTGDAPAITVQWSGMWLCIETDGHCHT